MKKRAILLTAATGFLASSFLYALRDRSDVELWVLFKRKRDAIRNIRWIFEDRMCRPVLRPFRALFKKHLPGHFDHILHLSRSGNSLRRIYRYDIPFHEQLFQNYRHVPIHFFSSQRILNGEGSILSENSSLYAENYYDLGKVTGELFLKSKNRHPSSKIFRIPLLTGANRGYRQTPQVLYSMIAHAIRGGDFRIDGHSAESGSSWIDADDLAGLLCANGFSRLDLQHRMEINSSTGWFSFSQIASYIKEKVSTSTALVQPGDQVDPMLLPASSYVLQNTLFSVFSEGFEFNRDIFKSVDAMIADIYRFRGLLRVGA
jgi:nucleoside-diphosphate-sugar epimerase